MAAPTANNSPLYTEYVALYQQEELDRVVAEIVDAEGHEDKLEKLRNTLAPHHVLSALGGYLKENSPEFFTILYGKDQGFAPTQQKLIERIEPKNVSHESKDSTGYEFSSDFVRLSKAAWKALKSDPHFKESEHGPNDLNQIKLIVKRIWNEKHKSNDDAQAVLQQTFDKLQEIFGTKKAKGIPLYMLISQKINFITEDAIDEAPKPKETEELRREAPQPNDTKSVLTREVKQKDAEDVRGETPKLHKSDDLRGDAPKPQPRQEFAIHHQDHGAACRDPFAYPRQDHSNEHRRRGCCCSFDLVTKVAIVAAVSCVFIDWFIFKLKHN